MVKVSDDGVALVAGSSSGIGFAIAKRLHHEGFRVVCHGRESKDCGPEFSQFLAENESSVRYFEQDFGANSLGQEIVDFAFEQWGRLDALVVSSGVHLHKDVHEVSLEEWRRVYAVNLEAPFFLAQSARPYLVPGSGSIIFVSSTNAVHVNRKNGVYDSSKAALNQMARSLALEWKNDGIRVNVVMPGGVETPMLQKWLEDYTGSPGEASTYLESARQSGLVGDPTDIAGAVLFLLSSDAKWITGVALTVDGGVHLES
jgi:NAD(P)-dependent dehydrogenase (short-subunit alcohol dehydrogenase family)